MNLLEGRDNEEVDAVRLSTLHAAKGLEFPHVYLVGVEEEILPHRECLEGTRLEEERRLMYVGITRARRGLVISWCAKRKRGGEITPSDPSRFVEEIDQNEVKRSGAVQESTDAKEDGRRRLSALKAMLAK
jgi:ATP-dependent DNA helicase Rep